MNMTSMPSTARISSTLFTARVRFDLAGDEEILRAGCDVVCRHAVARRAHRARRRAAPALRRVSARRDGGARVVRRVDAWNQHGFRAHVEHALEVRVVVPRDAHDADGRRGGHGMELRGKARHVAQPVLLVEHDIVEAGEAQDLGDLRASQHGPAAEDVLAVRETVLQYVWPIQLLLPS